MKVAVSGKGGSGKTTISGTLARSFAEDGLDVLAIDDDENPNLALTLGIDREQEVSPVPGDLLKRVETTGGETELELAKTPDEIVADYGAAAPAGIRMLKMGEVDHAGNGCMCRAHSTAREVLSEVVEQREEVTVMDMVAGVEHLGRGTAKDVDTLLVVVEPYYKSLETGRRTKELAAELDIPDVRAVANKVRDEGDREAIEDFCANNDLEIAAVVPFDDAVRHADQDGTAPFDYDADSGAVRAIRGLADDLVATHVGTA
jgi:CO dehydrogenase maturation factor